MASEYSVGMYPESRNEKLIVTTTSQVVSQSRNPGLAEGMRKAIVIRNIADPVAEPTKIITIVFGSQPAVANAGIVRKPGEELIDSSDDHKEVWQGQISIICHAASATENVAIHER